MYETESVSPVLAWSVNAPLKSVTVPTLEPFTRMLTQISGSPSFSDKTLPEIFPTEFCAEASPKEHRITARIAYLFNRFFVTFRTD